ncbi:hypothetical protein D3C75_261760 [compost metagenome]
MVSIIFGISDSGIPHSCGLFKHIVQDQIVFDVRVMRRCTRLNQEAAHEAVHIQEAQRCPFGDLCRNSLSLRLCLVRVVAVRVKQGRSRTCVQRTAIRILYIIEQENHIVQRFIDIQCHWNNVAAGIRCIIVNDLLCHQGFQELDNNVNTVGLIRMDVVQPDRHFIILKLAVLDHLLQLGRIIVHQRQRFVQILVYGRFVLGDDGEVDGPSLCGRSDLLVLHITAVFVIAVSCDFINRRLDFIICMIGIIRVQIYFLLCQYIPGRRLCSQVVYSCELYIFSPDTADGQVDAEWHIEVYQSGYRRSCSRLIGYFYKRISRISSNVRSVVPFLPFSQRLRFFRSSAECPGKLFCCYSLRKGQCNRHSSGIGHRSLIDFFRYGGLCSSLGCLIDFLRYRCGLNLSLYLSDNGSGIG